MAGPPSDQLNGDEGGENEGDGLASPDKQKPHRSGGVQNGADNGTRTRGLNLGKVALYQLSYVRKGFLP